jgi:hypothetical protein
MDLTAAIAPKSDQLNAEDLLTGERTFTIASVEPGSAEQPVNVHLVEMPGRPWRPSKSMSRVMAYLWGPDTEPYASRQFGITRPVEHTALDDAAWALAMHDAIEAAKQDRR